MAGNKHYRGNEYTRNNRRIVGRVIFYAVPVVSRKVGDWFFLELLVNLYILFVTLVINLASLRPF
jgi:uncharacterized membrane protein